MRLESGLHTPQWFGFLPHKPPLPCRHQTFLQLLHTLQGQLPFPEVEADAPRKPNLAEDEPQQKNTGVAMGRDGAVPSKVSQMGRGQGDG